MLKLFLIIALCCNLPNIMAQNYEKEWILIDSLEAKGLPESCLKETESLLSKIRKDSLNKNQTALLIKVLVYVNKFQMQLEEDGLEKVIYRFQTEIEKMSEGSAKAIMQSMLSEMYSNYLNNHIYKISDRTAVSDNKSDDISTWDIERISEKVFELYSKSISNSVIKTVRLSDYKDLLLGFNNELLEPTLFDLLINRAIDFYSNENSYLSKPAYRFYLDRDEALADDKTFVTYRFETKDSLSEKFRCLVMFQELIAFHIKDASPEALIDANLRRLKWVQRHSIVSNKDELYLKSLKDIAVKYEKNVAAAEALYEIAEWHEFEGDKYKPSPEQTLRWEYKKAVELSNEIIKNYPDSYGAKLSAFLISRIQNRSIDLTLEYVYPIDKPILVNLKYRNIKKGNFRLVRFSARQQKELNELDYGDDKIASYITKLEVYKAWSVELKDDGDFHEHNVDISVPAVKNGMWLLIASDKEDFSYKKNGISYSIFNVSNLSYFHRQIDGKNEYTLTDRNTGSPLENVKAEFYISSYNSISEKYEDSKIHEALSDKNGKILSSGINKENYYGFYVKFSRNGDELFLEDSYYNYKSTKNNIEKTHVHFFTDRAIYRPGQTVYFKGIVISTVNGKNPKIKSGYATDVIFNDANYQQIAKKSVISNEFGSFEGSFTAPSSGMTGQMQILETTNSSSHYFRVEEYKRPKFEAVFEPVKEAFKIDETVIVKGFGKAYAGNVIDGAKVQYRVVRSVDFPLWRWYWGWNPWEREEQEIVFGETKTNEKGEFAVSFKAIPDKSIPAGQKPQFTYTVYADVTDISGETHSTETQVIVGYLALNAELVINEVVNREKTKDLEINTTNLNGQFEPATGTIKIELLETPKKIFNTRFFDRADFYLISENDFKRDFPNMPYKSEDLFYNWKSVKTVLESNFDSKTDKKVLLKDIEKWAQGKYKITLNTTDKYGEKIELVKFFSLFSEKEADVSDNEVIFVANLNPTAEPGEKVFLDFGSFDKNANLLFEIEHEGKIIQSEWHKANNRIKKEILIDEKYRGGISFHITAVLNNRFYKKQGTISVPWTNKALQIEYSTFRDKLLPGQEEEWKIKISGAKKDKVAAEVLAAMYDASLDEFAVNDWYLSLYSNNWARLSWSSNCFNTVNSTLLAETDWNELKICDIRSYTSLNWFGFSFYDGYGELFSVKRSMAMDEYKMAGAPMNEALEEDAMPKTVEFEEGKKDKIALDTVKSRKRC